ncbi:MAG: hypothetical protein PHD38_08415 [Mesotoga sp.]|uniref:hypothetical protein n=1 Tax=unclassified Mesotoga TaxID=1184398 RepID=UPI000EF1F674|nr:MULTISPECIES: hypothetical protein [unclassified Mesotoga]MDI9368582.1 hypothetical protein [Thermotogota bacterium]NLT45058.1 hypothetical protein [Thermotogaceae bacterium]MDD2334413.1 hypothetical protein [Mesotoga sp.]MDD4207582.1 hypothetical protein [Mesotoga sp.]MDD5682129.1 hypothetical protein [Mesotoga sp.]
MTETRTMMMKTSIILAVLAMVESTALAVTPLSGSEIGVFYGTAFALIALLLINYDAQILIREKKRVPAGFLARYFFYGICFATAATVSLEFFLGSFLGVMNLKIAAIAFGRWLCET